MVNFSWLSLLKHREKRKHRFNRLVGFVALVRSGWVVLLTLGGSNGWADEPAVTDTGKSAETRIGFAREEPPADLKETYKRLIVEASGQLRQGNPVQTLQLLTRATQLLEEGATVDILFLAAQAHMRLGNHEVARWILEQLAKQYPHIGRFQLDHAAMLYSLGRDEEADVAFRKIHAKKDLPEPVQRNVEKYLQRIYQRRSLLIDYDFSVWKDDNVNNAAEIDHVEVPLFGGLRFTVNEKPIEAWVAGTAVSLLHRMPLREDGRLRMHSKFRLARNTARNAAEYNRTWLNLSTGPQWYHLMEFFGQRLPGHVGADIGYEKRWRGGNPYSGSTWIRFSARQSLSAQWSVGGYVRYWDTRYSNEDFSQLEPKGQALNLYTEHVSRNTRVIMGWTVSTEHPDQPTQRWKSHQGMLGYETVFGLNWHVSVLASLAETRYRQFDTIFQRRRKDQHKNFHVAVSNQAIAWNGYLPEFTFGTEQTKSNIDLYDRDSFILRFGFQKLF